MSTTLVPEAPPSLFDDASGPTLEDVVADAWSAIAAGETSVCPVCGGSLAPRYGAGAAPVGGRCSRCGAELS